MKPDLIKVADIHPNGNVRTNTKTKIDDLKKSIKKVGLINPITVKPADDGNGYTLIAGSRRLRAFVSLKMDLIPVNVVSSEDDVELLQTHENLHREDMPYPDYIKIVKKMISDGVKKKDIAIGLSKPVAWVTQAGKLGNLVPEIAEAVVPQEASLYETLAQQSHAYQREWLSSFCEDFQVSTLKQALDKYPTGWERDEIIEVLEDTQSTIGLDNAIWDIKKEFFGEGTPTCKGCEFRGDKQLGMFSEFHDADANKCLNLECYSEKTKLVQEIVQDDMDGVVEKLDFVSADGENVKTITFKEWLALGSQKKKRVFLADYTHWGTSQGMLCFKNIPKTHEDGQEAPQTDLGGVGKGDEPYALSDRVMKQMVLTLFPVFVTHLWKTLVKSSPDLDGGKYEKKLMQLYQSALFHFKGVGSNRSPVFGEEKTNITIEGVSRNIRFLAIARYIFDSGDWETIQERMKSFGIDPKKYFLKLYIEDDSFRGVILNLMTASDLKVFAEENDDDITGTKEVIVNHIANSPAYDPIWLADKIIRKFYHAGYSGYSLTPSWDTPAYKTFWTEVESCYLK